jgi:peptidoglycan/LPS O-acetylase OafA/YrhL
MAFLILFVFSYLRIMPLQYKLIVLGVVYCFTILMPTLTIFLFRKINGFTPEDLTERKRRYVPFILTITSYVFCLLMMHRLNIPWYMTGIIFASLIVMIICVIVNLKWKLSEHMAGAGAIIGGLVAFSALFGYNPVGWHQLLDGKATLWLDVTNVLDKRYYAAGGGGSMTFWDMPQQPRRWMLTLDYRF